MIRYSLENVSCPACSAKIETGLRQIPDLAGLVFNHAAGTVASPRPLDPARLEREIRRIDPGVRVTPAGAPATPAAPRGETVPILVAALLLVTATLGGEWLNGAGLGFVGTAGLVLAYLAVGLPVLARTARALSGRDFFNEHFLMSLATIGAFAIGSLPEAVSVMLFFRIGEAVEDRAVARSRRSIDALLATQPERATVRRGKAWLATDPAAVAVGATLLVRPGEKVPLDGRVTRGRSELDCASLTGEAVPVAVSRGSRVPAGAINLSGLLEIRAEKRYADSSIARILDLVQSATGKKSPTERFITRFARVYTPAVVLLALALAFLPPLVVPGARLGDWVYRALVLLVISCPCALVISIPLGYFGGIGAASRRGILVKGSVHLDRLRSLDTVAFDKTGTLTEGRLSLAKVVPAPGISRRELLGHAACAEAHSNHPVAHAIVRAAGRKMAATATVSHRELPGMGVLTNAAGRRIVAGNARLLRRERITVPEVSGEGIVVHVAVDRRYLGHLLITDHARPDAGAAIAGLYALGVRRVAMLSGDSPATAARVGAELGLADVRAGLLPEEKVRELEALMAESRGPTAFVGDGTNDAPVLARADLGVALGGIGSDAAIETADVVILGDSPAKLPEAVRIARRTRRVVFQNILLAFGVKAVFLAGAAFGIPSLWEAVFADVGVALLAILNASRMQR